MLTDDDKRKKQLKPLIMNDNMVLLFFFSFGQDRFEGNNNITQYLGRNVGPLNDEYII